MVGYTDWCFPRLSSDTPIKGQAVYEGWNCNSGNYLFTTDTK